MAAVGLGVADAADDGQPPGLPLGGQTGQARVEAPLVVEPVDLLRGVGQPRPGAWYAGSAYGTTVLSQSLPP